MGKKKSPCCSTVIFQLFPKLLFGQPFPLKDTVDHFRTLCLGILPEFITVQKTLENSENTSWFTESGADHFEHLKSVIFFSELLMTVSLFWITASL